MSDTFRKQYRELSDAEKEHVEQIKDTAERLEICIEFTPRLHDITPERERYITLALTNLEQAVMWAVKAAT
jgi:hypothetical protein